MKKKNLTEIEESSASQTAPYFVCNICSKTRDVIFLRKNNICSFCAKEVETLDRMLRDIYSFRLSLREYVWGDFDHPEHCDLTLEDNVFYLRWSICFHVGFGHDPGVGSKDRLCTLEEVQENGWEFLYKSLCKFSDLHIKKLEFQDKVIAYLSDYLTPNKCPMCGSHFSPQNSNEKTYYGKKICNICFDKIVYFDSLNSMEDHAKRNEQLQNMINSVEVLRDIFFRG